jgi:hypothetical protein
MLCLEKRSKIFQIFDYVICLLIYFMSPYHADIQTIISGEINFFSSHPRNETLGREGSLAWLFTNAGHKRNGAARTKFLAGERSRLWHRVAHGKSVGVDSGLEST